MLRLLAGESQRAQNVQRADLAPSRFRRVVGALGGTPDAGPPAGGLTMRSIHLVLFAAAGCLTSPPPELLAVATSPTSVHLEWTLVESEARGYQVERATTSEGGFDGLATVGAGAFEYTDTGLVPSTLYFYRLRPVTTGVAVSARAQVITPSTCIAPSRPINGFICR